MEAMASQKTLTADLFAVLMDRLGPFESAPHIAVAVSGGPDSLCLALLLADWLSARGGRLSVLTVDHGLRPESAAEARQVAAWLGNDRIFPGNIAHHILPWQGEKPAHGQQAAARAARYRLLRDWCRAADVLHLALAHHRDDQIETVVMRGRHGSGPAGLAGMSACRLLEGVRLLRPLLATPKALLLATLRQAGQPWIEDPSNALARFERARLRAREGAEAIADPGGVLDCATRSAALRMAWEQKAAGLLVSGLQLDTAGIVRLDCAPLHAASPEVAGLALSWLLQSLSGRPYPPSPGALQALLNWSRKRQPADVLYSLGGCLARLSRAEKGKTALLIGREPALIVADCPLADLEKSDMLWDRRFHVTQHGGLSFTLGDRIAPLGEAGWRALAALHCRGRPASPDFCRVPFPWRGALPALWRGDRPVAVADFTDSAADGERMANARLKARFLPKMPLTPAGFVVVSEAVRTI